MLADAIGYHSAIRFGIEHGKRNMVQPDYGSTAFLYTQPNETTIPGDDVNPSDPVSRFLHGYTDTDADDRVLISQYEGEDDTRTIYGANVPYTSVLKGDQAPPPDTRPFVRTVAKYFHSSQD